MYFSVKTKGTERMSERWQRSWYGPGPNPRRLQDFLPR